MTQALGTLTIASGNFQFGTPFTGIRGLIISNQSGFNCSVRLDGTAMTKNLNAGTADFFPISPGYTGTVIIVSTPLISNVASFPGGYLQFDAVGLTEAINTTAYPMQLAPPSVSSSATGKPTFSASLGIGSTASSTVALNIFNPTTSAEHYDFYSARAFSNDATLAIAQLQYLTGADINLAGGTVSIVSHNTSRGTTSTAHATFSDNGIAPSNTKIIEAITIPVSLVQDILVFPDGVTIWPGDNLSMVLLLGANLKNIRLTAKWTAIAI